MTKGERFLFVNGNESEARKHAMREHWRKRKERNSAAEKSLRILRRTPKKERMACRVEAQSHSDSLIPIQYHSRSQDTISIAAFESRSNMPPNPDKDTTKAAVLQSPCDISQPLKPTNQGGVESEARINVVCNLRVADAVLTPVNPDCSIEDSVYKVSAQGVDVVNSTCMGLYDVNDVPCVFSSKL